MKVSQFKTQKERFNGKPCGTLSVVVPVYFQEAVIEAFCQPTCVALAPLQPEFELDLVFVNDGSTDRSLEILLGLRERDPRVKVLHFSRNFGHQVAATAGLDHAVGGVVVVIKADLENYRRREEAPAIMQQRIAVYQAARARHPGRWSEGIRDWSLPDTVWLNPAEREKTQEISQAA